MSKEGRIIGSQRRKECKLLAGCPLENLETPVCDGWTGPGTWSEMRTSGVKVIRALLLFAPALSAQTELLRLLHGVEERYNNPRSMQFAFEQTQSGSGRITRAESGSLYLERPGRMLWDYRQPAGKFFLADGKFAYFYSPATRQVAKSPLKASDDLRAPLAFLMGRLDFQRDFKEFRTMPEGENTYIVALPKSEKAPYTQVAFLVTKAHQILRLRVTGQDQSVLVYSLSGERANPPLAAGLFTFRLPEGAELVEEQ